MEGKGHEREGGRGFRREKGGREGLEEGNGGKRRRGKRGHCYQLLDLHTRIIATYTISFNN